MTEFNVTLSEEVTEFNATFENVSEISHYTIYRGSYTVIPQTRDQVLETKNKHMIDDLVVKEIPTAEVSNIYGGKTFIIGE